MLSHNFFDKFSVKFCHNHIFSYLCTQLLAIDLSGGAGMTLLVNQKEALCFSCI